MRTSPHGLGAARRLSLSASAPARVLPQSFDAKNGASTATASSTYFGTS